MENPSVPLNKYSFASVFRMAWVDCVKVSTFVNSFREAGICPLNPQAISKLKLAPSFPLSESAISSSNTSSSEESTALKILEKYMKTDTLRLYKERLEEHYDCITDELYTIWFELKKMTISDEKIVSLPSPPKRLPLAQQRLSPAIDEVLTEPNLKQNSFSKEKKWQRNSNLTKAPL